jgi:hypothetical protein
MNEVRMEDEPLKSLEENACKCPKKGKHKSKK